MNKPLISMFLSILLGTSLFCTVKISLLSAVIITALFLITIYKSFSKKYMVILLLFVIVSYVNTHRYYNLHKNTSISYKVIIDKLSGKNSIGIYKGRKVLLEGNLKKYKEKDILLVKGKFKNNIDIEKGIAGIIFIDNVKKISENKFNNLTNSFYKKLKGKIGEENSNIILSACLGKKEHLMEEQKETINKLGIAHVISVSGFHMAIVYKVIEKISGFWLGNFIALMYVIITGSKSASVRAFIMIFILNLSKKIFKNYDNISALLFSACILVLYKPYLIYDFGFNLTYLATLGILLFYKRLQRKLYFLPNFLNDICSISLSAQIFTLPYIAFTIKSFSLNFLLSNIFIIPIFTPLIILGNLAFVFFKVEFLFDLICFIILAIFKILNIILNLSLKIMMPTIYLSNVTGYYFLSILICTYFIKNKFNQFKRLPIIFLIISFVLVYDFIPKVNFINENYNKAIVIEKGFSNILISNSKSKYFLQNINKEYQISKIMDLKRDNFFNLGKYYFKSDKNLSDLYVVYKNKRIMFTQNKEYSKKSNYYDIIPLDNRKSQIFKLF